jgi:hypothetical protein
MILHFFRYQGIAVDDYSYNLDALELRHPWLLQRKGKIKLDLFI